VICSKLLCSFHGVLLLFRQSSLPPRVLCAEIFHLARSRPVLHHPRQRSICSCHETAAVSLRKAHSLNGPRPSVIWSETDPLFGSPVPVQEPRICRHPSAHYPPDVRPINGSPFHSATGHPGCRSLLHWARCSPQSSMALSFRTDSSEMRGRSVSCDGRNKISS